MSDLESPDGTLVVDAETEDRYSAFRMIPWWDQDLLRRSFVMVVGAGALGNEILKNLALLGIGRVLVIDSDTVETSNLARSVLFRAQDQGHPKAEVAATAMAVINPDTRTQPFVGNVIHDLGLGAFRAVDLVLCGLDNREARLWVNQSCWRVNRPWIDGAIEALTGVARVFLPPDSACYECTMNEVDRKLISHRMSCALLGREQMMAGRIPTTPTTSSVIAGIQCQEAVKLLHNRQDLPVLEGKGFFFNGLNHDSFVVTYPRKPDCLSHESFDEVVETRWQAGEVTLSEVLHRLRLDLGDDAFLELPRELVSELRCAGCATNTAAFRLLGRVSEKEARCPSCGAMREMELTHIVTGDEPFLSLTLAEIGVPTFDIVIGRSGALTRYYELSGDRDTVLGQLAEGC